MADNEVDRPSVNLLGLKRQTPARGGGLKASFYMAGYFVFNYLVFMPLPMVGSFSILRVM